MFPGVAGNVGAIFVSRISTALHGSKDERYWMTAVTLFSITTPILIAFLGFVWGTNQLRIGWAFAISYVLLSFGIVRMPLAVVTTAADPLVTRWWSAWRARTT